MPELTDLKRPESSVSEQPQKLIRTLTRLSAEGFDRLAAVFCLYLAVALVYWPSTVALNAIWGSKNTTFKDGYLVLLVSLWLIVRDRKRLAATSLQPLPAALITLAAASFLWVLAWRAAIQEAHLELVPVLLITAVAAALGWRAVRILGFPIGYLYFAMPMWDHLNGLLQSLSARMTGVLIWITGLPAFMQGNFIHLPWGTIQIAGGCSGLHSFTVGLALGALYGKLAEGSPRRRLLWLGIMGLLALIANWVRIFVITVVAYATRLHSPLVRHHIWFGWLLFALTFAAFLWWAERSQRSPDSKPSEDLSAAGESLAPAAGYWPRGFAPLAITLLALAVLPLASYGMDWARGATNTPVRIQWPQAAPRWKGPQPVRSSNWVPRFLNSSAQSLVQYTDAAQPVQMYAVAYRVQTQAGKLLGYWNSLLGEPQGLRAAAQRIIKSPSGSWRETLAIDRAGERSLIWARYRIGERVFVDPRLAQLWYGFEALVRPPLSSLTALRAVCTPDCKAAEKRLTAATAWAHPTLR